MSWGDRFALIDSYQPTTAAICVAFNLSPQELSTAIRLREAGTFIPNSKLDVSKFAGIFPEISEELLELPISQLKISTTTIHSRPESATKKIIVKQPQKRGRKGDKIAQALFAVTNTPTPVDQFTREHNISLAVLRQSKRFTEHMSETDIQRIGKINVKQDKSSKVLMIWREDL